MKCRTKTAKQKKAPPKGEKIMAKRVFIIVLDSFGIGEMPDAARFGDACSSWEPWEKLKRATFIPLTIILRITPS